MERPRHPVNVSPLRGAALAASLLALGACSWLPTMPSLPGTDLFDSPRVMRGHAVDAEDLAQVTVGVSSRSDVASLLGSPTATGTFDEDSWYYISAVTRQRPGRALAIDDQQVVAIRFDARGTVTEVRRLGPEAGQQVRFVQRETASPGTERTLLQQLFGNIGRLGPGLGAGQQGGPGAPSPSGTR
ncbi:outer membrane protein assembly factor BamE [Falsiroseomonas sp. CW058]|uniref:outer membrane protein assembly factor BamE n=1 Tax=Falsiroseomonas sp. CW058 TaxID=3388664 RepID=UPI003D31CCE1